MLFDSATAPNKSCKICGKAQSHRDMGFVLHIQYKDVYAKQKRFYNALAF